MRGEHPTVTPDDTPERNQLRLVGKGAWRIDKPERQACGALHKLGFQKVAHGLRFFRRGRAVVMPHDGKAKCGMPHKRHEIERDASALCPAQRVAVAIEIGEDFVMRRFTEKAGKVAAQILVGSGRGGIEREKNSFRQQCW